MNLATVVHSTRFLTSWFNGRGARMTIQVRPRFSLIAAGLHLRADRRPLHNCRQQQANRRQRNTSQYKAAVPVGINGVVTTVLIVFSGADRLLR
jgi:hypothetical protein